MFVQLGLQTRARVVEMVYGVVFLQNIRRQIATLVSDRHIVRVIVHELHLREVLALK